MADAEWRIHAKPYNRARTPRSVIGWLGIATRRPIGVWRMSEDIERFERFGKARGATIVCDSFSDTVTGFWSAHR